MLQSMKANSAVICVLLAGLNTVAAHAGCDDGFVDVRMEGAEARFSVAVADDPQEQAQGLMFVEEMPPFSGMLFVNPSPRRAMFWMKNTLIPLDMLFLDERGVVKTLHENAVPHSEETIDGGNGIKAVLEINGGMAEKLGIEVGAELRHGSFDQDLAAWPCQ